MEDATLEKIYLDFLKDNPTIEHTRRSSARSKTGVNAVILIGFLAEFMAIIAGNLFWALVVFVGLITLIISLHFLTKKRLDFNHTFEDLKFKYIEKLLSVNKKWSITYLDQTVSA